VVLRDVAARSVTFWLMTEDLPRGDNRVTVDDDGRVKLSVRHQYNRGAHRDLYRELSWRLDDAGFPFHLRKEMGIGAVAHQCGTLRMSETVNGGPVNRDGRAWDTGNLYVGDASVFPSSGAVNPALTVMALALRLGEHLTGGRP
jgi:choline dehydrogenase-like flavoprotein